MLSQYIGGGYLTKIPITVRVGKSSYVANTNARMGIFGSDLGVGQGSPERHRGVLLVPKWKRSLIDSLRGNGRIVFTPDLLVHQVVGDLFEAIRQQEEILWNYGEPTNGERGEMRIALAAVEEINRICLGLKRVVNREAVEAHLMTQAETALGAIGLRPIDAKKIEASDYVQRLATILDTRGRPNPSAKAAQSLAAGRRLSERQEVIDTIEPIIVYRREVLRNFCAALSFIFTQQHDFLQKFFWNDLRLADGDLRRSVAARLRRFTVDLLRVDVKPSLATAEHLRREYGQAIAALETQRLGQAKEILRRSWQSLKLRQIRIVLEDVITDLARAVVASRKPRRMTVPVEVRKQYAHRIDVLLNALGRVDERGFRHRVIPDAQLALAAAIDLLGRKAFMPENLKDVKEYLKAAGSTM